MMANEKQVGGAHYQTGAMQHWDLIDKWKIPYLYGCASKYVARAGRKGSMEEDLMKAIHFLEKAEENKTFPEPLTAPGVKFDIEQVFAPAAKLSQLQTKVLVKMLTAMRDEDIEDAIEDIRKLMMTGPGTPEDGGHHAEKSQ